MNRTESQVRIPALATLPSTPPPDDGSPGRLVVVISEISDQAALATHIVRSMVTPFQGVLLVGVPSSLLDETRLRRNLVLLAAFLRDASSQVEIIVDRDRGWLQRLSAVVRPNDRLACGLERPSSRPPLHDVLSSHFQAPVHVFTGDLGGEEGPRGWLQEIAPWVSSVAVILVFLWFQILLSRPPAAPAQSVLLILTLPVEVGFICLCNSLLG